MKIFNFGKNKKEEEETILDKTLKWCKIVFYVMLMVSILLLSIRYGSIDFNKISKEFSETTRETLENIKCDISYNGFEYHGKCSEFYKGVNNTFDMYVRDELI